MLWLPVAVKTHCAPHGQARGRRVSGCLALLLRLAAVAVVASAAPALAVDVGASAVVAPATGSGVAWSSLTAAQKNALAPLQRDWPTIDASGRDKWLEVAGRFPSMSGAERQRVQDRMAEWSRQSPKQRAQTRLQFQEARQVSPADRQAKWQAYQALPEEQRRELADRARPALNNPTAVVGSENRGEGAADSKRNIVQPQRSTPARPVAPTVVQAKPGATTTLMSAPPSPPVHNQAGLPKIAATEGFVNPSTLLPKRGPQGAAVQAASASQPAARR
jgi:hypothetical protein